MSAEVDIKQLAIVRDAREAPALRPRRHVLSRYVIPGVLLVGFFALVAWAARDAVSPPASVWVTPVLASQSRAQHEGTPLFQAAGWIEPRPTPIRVAALAPGVVEQLLVVENQAVKAGEPVAELVKEDAELAHRRALANVKLREAECDQSEASLVAASTRLEQPVHLQAALSEAEAALAATGTALKNLPFELRRAEAQLEFATADYEGKRSSEGSIAGRIIVEAKSARDAAAALVEELKSRAESLANEQTALIKRRDALRTQLELLAEEKQAKAESEAMSAAAAARLEQARVELAEAKLRLDRMTIRAPIDGRVFELIAYPGTTLSGGMGPVPNADGSTVVTLYRPDMLQVRVDVRFADIPKVSLGQPVLINNPALAEPISGKVLFVSSEANIQKNTLEVKVALDAPIAVFKPEMLVDVTYLAPKAAESVADDAGETRLYLPQQFVLQGESGPFVWVADQSDGVARKTAITTGSLAAGGLVEVTQGLTVGSRIISRGHESLSDGERIRVENEDAPAAASTSAAVHEQHAMRRLPTAGE
ncbi:MAG TPA: efflux RND transporter periplasmic adaptor subunit [Lacipirellulaceae bacterium]|nr:efflux RND transporter periplasmic adaptor subunit [Lacipirellulaceae bacterium]